MSAVAISPIIVEQSVRAVVTRADGTVEDLGLIAFYSRNPLRKWAYKLGRALGFYRR